MFNESSIIAQAWKRSILSGAYKYSQVPQLYNLREVVAQLLNSEGYDINSEQ